MRNNKTELLALALGSALSFPAYADPFPQAGANPQSGAGASTPAECVLLGIAVNYNFDGTTSANAKNELDSRLYKLNMFLLQNKIDKLETLSMSYKITQDDEKKVPRMYHLAGAAEYQINSTDGAFKIGQFLTHERFQTTVSYKPIKPEQCIAAAEVVSSPTPSPSTPGAPVAPVPNLVPISSAAGAAVNAVKDVLKQKAPGLDNTDSMPFHNYQVPDIPGLQNAPPSAEPLNEKR